jgi:hypothetical protein
VDGDSIPEIILEAGLQVYIIKAADTGNREFYVWDSLPGKIGGSAVVVYDIDNNGYDEVIISVNDTTHIYEYQSGFVQEKKSRHASTPPIHASIFAGPIRMPDDIAYKIFDITGRQIHTLDPAPGIYFIEVNGKIRQKVIKIK